jgi:PAS domain S-box-containing protein
MESNQRLRAVTQAVSVASIGRSEILDSATDATVGVDDDGVIILANTLAVNLFGYPREELIGQSIELIVPHSARTDEARRTGDLENSQTWPIASGLELEARAADGTEFPCEISLLLMEWKGARLSLAAIRDITDRRQVEEKLQLAAGRVQAATEIAVAVGSETDLGRVLETIVERARTLVEARALMLLLTQGDELVISAMAGDVDDALQGQRVKRTDDLLWEVFRLPSSATALIVPLAFRGTQLGTLLAVDRLHDGPGFGGEDERLLQAFGASAATAVATAQSVAAERLRDSIRASERERSHWARELHDETLQGLAGVLVTLKTAMQSGSADDVRAAANHTIEGVSSQIETLRGLITELRPAALGEIGLESALSALVERSAKADGLTVVTKFEVSDSIVLGDELETGIYRLAQEGLHNVSKHSRVDRAELEVRSSDGYLHLHVRDDGVGFETSIVDKGFGLVGMQERVTMLGGTFEVVAASGAGTEIHAKLPLPDAG